MIFTVTETLVETQPCCMLTKPVPTLVFSSEDEMQEAYDLLAQAFPNKVYPVICYDGYYNAIQMEEWKLSWTKH